MTGNRLPQVNIVPATPDAYPLMQDIARLYLYDMLRFCGCLPGWEISRDGLRKTLDVKKYLNFL